MITSEKQHQAAKDQLKRLQASLNAPMKSGVAQAITEAGKLQTQKLINEIGAEIDQYEKTQGMRPSEIPIHSIDYSLGSDLDKQHFLFGAFVRLTPNLN